MTTTSNENDEENCMESEGPEDPQKQLIMVSDAEISEIIGVEANYDRWANFLFPHTKSQDLHGRRKKVWTINMPDGATAEAQIEVIPAQDEKCYTERTYSVFLALMQIWQERGMPEEPMEIFINDVCKKLDLRTNGRVVANIIDELRCLEETKVSWIFSFQTQKTRDDTYKNKRVLDVFDYTQKKDRVKGQTKTRCEVRFSQHIRDNFRNKVTIPVNFTARKKIASSIARTWYSRIDNILAKRPIHERTALGLVEDLNMTIDRYKHKSQRKEFVERLQRYLDGVELSRQGVYLIVDIAETADKKDWKCIFRSKGGQNALDLKSAHKLKRPIVNSDKKIRESLIIMIDDVVGGKDTNYGLYNSYALYYSETLIMRAISEYKEIISFNHNIGNKEAYFTAIMHTLVHKTGGEWIKSENCGDACRYRPENQLFPL